MHKLVQVPLGVVGVKRLRKGGGERRPGYHSVSPFQNFYERGALSSIIVWFQCIFSWDVHCVPILLGENCANLSSPLNLIQLESFLPPLCHFKLIKRCFPQANWSRQQQASLLTNNPQFARSTLHHRFPSQRFYVEVASQVLFILIQRAVMHCITTTTQ